jgi:hypothetical protein
LKNIIQSIKYLLPVLIILLLLSSCRSNYNKVDRGFYFWKTTWSVSPQEASRLHNLHISKIYLRLLDVDWDSRVSSAIPVGEIKFTQRPDPSFIIVPVVFITNKILLNSKVNESTQLADKIFNKINQIMNFNYIPYNELQLDCDWTESTRIKYFSIIKSLKDKLSKDHKIISATIRLHQVKYPERTGIPPVDRGALMFYNMGKIDAMDNKNSIYNKEDASHYVSFVKNYPIQLDVVLPLFGWIVHIRNNKVIELINGQMVDELPSDNKFKAFGKNSYISDDSFFLHGYYFMKGDILKIENADVSLCRNAADLVSPNLKHVSRTVSIFDYDSLKISKYNEKDFKNIYSLFN